MSTWQQHVLVHTTTDQFVNNQTVNNNNVKLVETIDRLGEIDHTSALSGDFGKIRFHSYRTLMIKTNISNLVFSGKLYNQSEYSDIELIIESEHFYAHRVILAARSEYFRALLFGGLRESQDKNPQIEIKECKADAFKILLLYIYTGKINLIKEKVNLEFEKEEISFFFFRKRFYLISSVLFISMVLINLKIVYLSI